MGVVGLQVKKPARKVEDVPLASWSGHRRLRKEGSATRRLHGLQVTAQRKRSAVSSTRRRMSRTASSGSDTGVAAVSSVFDRVFPIRVSGLRVRGCEL
jgi:hypothetical protein